MHPYQHAQTHPDRPALVVADSGEQLTYRELDEGSNRAAQLFRSLGLRPGDKIGLMLKNSLEYAVIFWAAQRSGLIVVLLSTHLKPEEAAYILNDSNAKLLITSTDIGETAATLSVQRQELIPKVEIVFNTAAQSLDGTRSFHQALSEMPPTPISDQISGFYILYSSGTTGRPKGIVIPFKHAPIEEPSPVESATKLYENYDPLVTLCPGPLYHGAPLNVMFITQRLGGTFVTLRKFEAAQTLKALQDWRVVHAQFVPTMFVRMLALPDEVRRSFDLSSLKYVAHAAAPCPVDIKRRMIEWLGPIIDEYYGASENLGGTYITSKEWLRKPGSVGRSQVGPLHICDEDGRELAPGQEGIVYFEVPADKGFNYLNDPEKTSKARHPAHATWYTVGDIGKLDDEGYLFLTDRRDFMIISGGVNIYPQAVEDALIVHPKVLDAAVIGVPNPDFGEEVMAIVQPKNWDDAGDNLAAELTAWCQSRISTVSRPRSVKFVRELPRLASGKLAKRELRRIYGAPWSI
ncbi:MAG: acyl-CoA synthetase [Rhodospirillaceae bacterium]|nr:MAG: acyl-CoA synthetase [Rhodospirillaceae bacterium]